MSSNSLYRRLGALEELVEEKVQARLEEELEAAFDRLTSRLSREEVVKVMEILAEEHQGED